MILYALSRLIKQQGSCGYHQFFASLYAFDCVAEASPIFVRRSQYLLPAAATGSLHLLLGMVKVQHSQQSICVIPCPKHQQFALFMAVDGIIPEGFEDTLLPPLDQLFVEVKND